MVDFGFDDVRKAITDAVGDQLAEGKSVRLGHPITKAIKVPLGRGGSDQPGMVWTFESTRDDDGAEIIVSIGQALNEGKGKLIDNQLVWGHKIRIKPYKRGWVVDGTDYEDAAEYTYNVELREQPLIPLGQIDIGLLKPTDPPSMSAVAGGGLMSFNNVTYYVAPIPTDIYDSDDIPADEDTAYVKLVQLDVTTLTLHYEDSVEFPSTLDHVQAFNLYPQPDEDKFLVGWIRFVYGMTAITNAHILAGQEILSKTSVASSSFDVNTIMTDETTGQVMIDEVTGNVLVNEVIA